MPAGMNVRARIWRFSTPTDDVVGGAVPTGTVVYDPVFCRILDKKPTQALLEQGLETPSLYDAVLEPSDIELKENDQLEVMSPPISIYYQHRFVIIGVHPTSFIGRHHFIALTLRRFEQAHGDLHQ